MPKPEQIQSDELRPIMQDAHRALREQDPNTVVHRCADAFLLLAKRVPRVTQLPPGVRMHPFPRLGAMLRLREGEPPEIEFEREEFSFAEALTYYEYVLTTILAVEKRAAGTQAGATAP
jgi:hypothetical protein